MKTDSYEVAARFLGVSRDGRVPDASVLSGRVSRWFHDRHFGFILPADGDSELFFHASGVQGERLPRIGQQVTFELGEDRLGRTKAVRVRVVG